MTDDIKHAKAEMQKLYDMGREHGWQAALWCVLGTLKKARRTFEKEGFADGMVIIDALIAHLRSKPKEKKIEDVT